MAEDAVQEIHSTLITYAIMGHEDTWTPEQRVRWNDIETMYGDDGATDTLIVPTKDVLSMVGSGTTTSTKMAAEKNFLRSEEVH